MSRATTVTNLADLGTILAASLRFTPCDSIGNSVPLTGREVLVIRNRGDTPRQVTVHSSPAPLTGRTRDAVFDVPAGGMVVTQVFPVDGWRQADGSLWLTGESDDVEFAVVRFAKSGAWEHPTVERLNAGIETFISPFQIVRL